MAKKYFRCDYSRYQSEPCEDAVCIPLTKGYHALVSVCDFESIGIGLWQAKSNPFGTPYAISSNSKLMHRMILALNSADIYCDHIDGNGLNNQRNNLRESTKTQNQWNIKSRKGSSSIYKGVSKDKRCNGWFAKICVNKKKMYIGYFKTEEDAALAYNKKAIEYHGSFARLNEIPQLNETLTRNGAWFKEQG